jgi:hypothetical protein
MCETVRAAAIAEDRLIRRLNKLVLELDLDHRDFVIFGSGPLLAHGLRRSIRDLDVVARGATWRRVSEHGVPSTGAISGAPMALFWGGRIQFSPEWISPEWNPDDLIDRAEITQGLPFAQLSDVLAYKQTLGRPKDRPDIAVLLALQGPACRTRALTPQEPAGHPRVPGSDPSELLNSRETGYDSPFSCTPGKKGVHEKGGAEGEIGRFRRRHLDTST